jgi:RNA polymerase subunit RPABC4/transcription elongation factor Spt4
VSTIDTLPLDMFDDGADPTAEPAVPGEAPPTSDATPAPAEAALAPVVAQRWCQWCGAVDDPTVETCPTCGGRLTEPPDAQRPVSADGECQWCDAKLPPDTQVCPSCGSRVADPSQTFYGLNAPLPGTDLPPLRTPYGYPYPHAGDVAAHTTGEVVGGIISAIIRNIG